MAGKQDLISGGLFAGLGFCFGAAAVLELPMGTVLRMGPGYFPAVLSAILMALGILIMILGRGKTSLPDSPFPWRGAILIPLAILCFSLVVRRFGLAPALIAAAFITAYSSRTMTWRRAAVLSVALTAFCAIIFKWGLNITPPLFGRS